MKKNNQHSIDFIFPVTLFFIFSTAALIVLLLAANLYQGIVRDSAAEFEKGTTLSYITSKIRQNDSGGTDSIYLDEFNGYDALAIEQTHGDRVFVTYIYEAEGQLKEIFLPADVTAPADAGTTIMNVSGLEMEEIGEGLFEFHCTAEDGTTDSAIVSVHSDAS